MRRLRRWYIPACRGQREPAGRASPQAGAGLRARAHACRGRRRPAARIAAAVYVSPELYSLPVSQEFASLRPPLGGRTRLVYYILLFGVTRSSNGSVVNATELQTWVQLPLTNRATHFVQYAMMWLT